MTSSAPTRLVIAAVTIAIVVVLAVASRRESDPCAWGSAGRVTNVYDCMLITGENR